MTFIINIIKEESVDPDFKVNVSLYEDNLCVKNARVVVLRKLPKISFYYSEEIKEEVYKIDQKELELEILNKLAEYLMQIEDKNGINTCSHTNMIKSE